MRAEHVEAVKIGLYRFPVMQRFGLLKKKKRKKKGKR